MKKMRETISKLVFSIDENRFVEFTSDFPTNLISSASFPGPSTKFMSRANDFWIDVIEKK